MLAEVNIAGIYIPPLLFYACIALPVFMLLQTILARIGVLRRVWHPALVEFAMALSIFALFILFI
ncbi:DUF1656 domain-containing protein [Rhizobium lusitanum]|uniref:DUF1656 domain-containing protein n=1 Tax=Rhizobium lusitanum TaxID=293958 RepID=A0A6L9U881_9HYPH|nr:DUF1656 domain-containing protein [Rhizobium lusitanum]NEI72145.1 DUF1656 domain-containing protein [Rhizobium lusitanum]